VVIPAIEQLFQQRCPILLLPLVVSSILSSQTISSPSAKPSSIPLATRTTVTITAGTIDPSLIGSSVNLQRYDSTAKLYQVVSSMYDDGTHGDAVAGDGIFSVALTFDEPAPFPVVLRVSAAFKGRLTRVFSSPFNLNVVGEAAPRITITSPSNLSYFNSSPITVHGTVTEQNATVEVNGVAAPVSGNAFAVSIPVLEGPNTIAAIAQNSQGASSTATIQVSLDTTPPRITIDSPFDGYVTSDPSITVTGKANDIVPGTVNDQQVQVMVNGVTAAVSNRSFQALSVPLAVGNNTIAATGIDRAGNSGEFSITVTRVQATQPHIRVVSGNNQTGPVSTALGQPLIVQLLDGLGSPIASQTVIFTVTQNNGLLNGSAGPKSVLTDSNGQAHVAWTLGSRAGSGTNLMEASVAGVPGSAIFTATGVPGMATKIVVDSGGQQTGSAGQSAPNPLIVVVTDNAHNRLASVPVTFQVVNGGGNFGGKPNVVVNTDSDGRALAILTLGPNDGIANNLVQATFQGNKGFPSAFSLNGRSPGNPAATLIKGVVLDNSNNPVLGATIRAYVQNVPAQVSAGLPPSATATSDAQGQFSIQPAPVGFVKLLVDGSSIQRPGKWPNLEYELVTVPGQINTLGQPIYLLPIDTQHQACVSNTVGGTVTLPQVPGFALTILPGSATFPGGSKAGCVSVTPVHPDKIPMVPGFGQQPKFIVTIQPAGTLFNPPAQITIPNSDALKPGEITEMYGFDHDLGMFVSIGTGTAGADGTVIKSDRGVGVVKAGWFCGGPPADAGGAGTCPNCQKCNGTACVPDPDQQNVMFSGTPPRALCVGDTKTLVAIGCPPGGSYQWSSSDSSIVSVNPTSSPKTTATGNAPGTATITVKYTVLGKTLQNSVDLNAVKILQDADLWWFNMASPANYKVNVTLTAQGASTGSFHWEVVDGTDKVNFENNATSIDITDKNTVGLKSIGASASAANVTKDVTIRLTYNGTAMCDFTTVVFAPSRLVFLRNVDLADATYGYESDLHYSIKDQFNRTLSSNVELNEHFTTGQIADFPGMNWRFPVNGGATVAPTDWFDKVQGEGATFMPTPQNPQNPLGGTKVSHWDGEWSIGSTGIGAGLQVQTNTWQKYRDHARHTNVASPP
jgi:Glucodextranase, domain B